ncbi:ABC transporter substrate-binding protein [Vineibacter terrae]|uniref:ABC transporter substrate-binding protein n=1 Tax=Vineibacter terrae TaxID=2586908 RepID=UPI002E34E30A|nr:ABC transporter substrate-binding protein [Vineibacter terrae]HEX2885574.1 ABC transporter substrate-binding protein [Vineibacter terrae]
MSVVLLGAAMAPAMAQISDDVVKLGVLTDMSSVYADILGPGSVAATQLAIDDFGGTVAGKKIELIHGDVLNKADVAATTAGRWYDTDKVDVILGAGGSASSIAAGRVAADKKRVFLATDPASSDVTGKHCNAYTIHWTYDTASVANGIGAAIVKSGGASWYFLTADYAFGHALERDISAVVTANGGKVLGSVRHPLNTSDFSSFLLQAQASKAQIVALANGGSDTTNAIKQAGEFGIAKGGQKLAAMVIFVTDVNSLGLPLAQGLQLTEAFYWDRTEGTRAFAKRFAAKMGGRMPTSVQAGNYSAAKLYLKTVQELGTDDADKVMAKLKSSPADDEIFGKSVIRAVGRKVHDTYLFEVKKPAESKGPWDFYKLLATIPGDQAFRPMDKGDCPLVTKK